MRFADFHTGMVIDVGARRAVTEAEIVEFASRYDPQWFHTDPVRAQSSRWNGLISSGWMTCAIAMELAVKSVLADSESIGSPGVEQIKWPHPLRPGDEVGLRVEVLGSRVSRSGSMGVVRWRWLLETQRGATVLDLIATSLFGIDAAAPAAGAASAGS
jgi:acyl dehydratase